MYIKHFSISPRGLELNSVVLIPRLHLLESGRHHSFALFVMTECINMLANNHSGFMEKQIPRPAIPRPNLT